MKNIKKIIAVLLCLLLTFLLVACKDDTAGGSEATEGGEPEISSNVTSSTESSKGGILGNIFGGGAGGNGNDKNKTPKTYDYTDPSIYTIDVIGAMGEGASLGMLEARKEPAEVKAAADKLLKEIENYPDTVEPAAGGKKIYVSNSGKDSNDGLSPETPVATLSKAGSISKKGDAIYLKRGNFWRERITLKAGVSLGAYGSGNKPTLYGSIDGMKLEWKQDSGNSNLWYVDINTAQDIGNIVFDHGKAFANKKNSKEEVIRDLNFYYQPRGTTVYLYSKENPTQRFDSIEICKYDNLIQQGSNSTVQNIRLMYTGTMGLDLVNTVNTMTQGLVIGYVGGCYQKGNGTTRLGNGIQLWGSCDGHYIDHCHVYQCYDAGVSPQWRKDNGTGTVSEVNIKYTNNLLEYSVYNFEYFLRNTTGEFSNVEISNNIMRYGGYGWGTLSRPEKSAGTNIQGGNSCKSENFVIKDNIFVHGMPKLIRIRNTNDSPMPEFIGNTYIVNKNRDIYHTYTKVFAAKDYVGKTAAEVFGDETGKLIIY